MSILKSLLNIRLKTLKRGLLFCSLLLLGGCSPAMPEEIQKLLTVQKENCWPCTGYKVVWEGIGNLTTHAFPNVCGWALNFLGVAVLFWILFTVGKFLVALKEPNIKDFFTGMVAVLFKSLIVAAILFTPENTLYILDLCVTPVIGMVVDLARGIMFADPTIAKSFAAASSYDSMTGNSPIFTAEIGNQLQDIVYRVYLGFSSGIGLGARMLVSTDVVSWGLGLFIMFVFIYLMLVIPLVFMEGFIILGIVIVMFPFFLISFIFPSTKNFMKEAWHALFIGVMQILVTCIYLAVLISVIKTYSKDFSVGKQMTDVLILTGLKSMSTNALGFFALIYCMFKMAGDIPRITSFLTGAINRTQMMAVIGQMTGMATQAGKFIAGAAMVGTGIGSAMGSAMMADAARNAGTGMYKGGILNDSGENIGGGDNSQRQAEAARTAGMK